ncbi:site-specific integrase [Ruegeria sp. 2205SS24-7]|uniref:site-specific integrase n=1 Tax=Ruegeria discodermiae TaxID=3064389 RepID=UPI002740B101|nr:site-specific integrase [Ruegeria sp. 2205SS24-7]MDP5220038.1 site-specific integrase [Ruegeria sp. 2205SS24-7]
MVKHLRIEKNGTYKYLRRVPERLRSALGKSEIVKVLGRSEPEAMRNYLPFHDHVEHLLRSTKPSSASSDLWSLKSSIEAQFIEAGLDLHSKGRSSDEELARSEQADVILSRYPTDPSTGQASPEDVSEVDSATVTALLNGIQSIKAELTVSQAFAFYLYEKQEPDPYKRKKQLQRFGRAERNLLNVTKHDVALTKVSRAHARTLRDNLLRQMASSSVKRNINDVKAVFSLAIEEHDLNINNPFNKLRYPKPDDAAIDLRHPLPVKVIQAMYRDLENNRTLQDIWTLIHHSGARSAEVLGLTLDDLFLDETIPYFEIKPQGLRSVKDRSRIRKVPLIGRALVVARRLKLSTSETSAIFPQYAESSRHDNFSQVTRRRLRKYTDNPKHVVYSLRHNMKDALRAAGVGERVELALLGHSSEKSASSQYGSGVGLEELRDALLKIDFKLPDLT